MGKRRQTVELDPVHVPPANFAILYDSTPKQCLAVQKALGPYGFVIPIETRPPEQIPDFTTLHDNHIAQPRYLIDVRPSVLRYIVKKICNQMVDLDAWRGDSNGGMGLRANQTAGGTEGA